MFFVQSDSVEEARENVSSNTKNINLKCVIETKAANCVSKNLTPA